MSKPRIHHELLRKALGLPTKLPQDFSARFRQAAVPLEYEYVPLSSADLALEHIVMKYRSYYGAEQLVAVPLAHFGADVVVKPGPVPGEKDRFGRRSKSSRHRIFVVCPVCGREIPAGRWHQHIGAAVCTDTSAR
jgi:hypothetical protein